ncbi:MAG TPA: glycosyltransferase family 9 protein [Candidatus Binataceae bacterium]|nr:glycosyltransferase family 9 protein [Candidatus Binataceae bacterium]
MSAMEESIDSRGQRMLVIFPGALGDLICLKPALEYLRGRNPNASFELMARAELARFAVGRLPIDRGHSIDRREVAALFVEDDARTDSDGRSDDTGLAGAAEFFGQFTRTWSFFAADNRRFRERLIGTAGGAVSFHPFRPETPGHVASGYAAAVGADTVSLDARIEALSADHEAAAAILARQGMDRERAILIFPGSGSHSKNWPVAGFIALAHELANEGRAPLFVLGPAEAELAVSIRDQGIVVEDSLGLGEVTGLARRCGLFIGNDSGVSHLAAAAGARGVVLFGPTDPARWRPLGDIAVVRKEPLATLPAATVMAALRTIRKRPGTFQQHDERYS